MIKNIKLNKCNCKQCGKQNIKIIYANNICKQCYDYNRRRKASNKCQALFGKEVINKLIIKNMDCIEGIKNLPDQSIDLVLTDPPYGIDGMGEDWDHSNLSEKTKKAGVIGSMPVGMKFDPKQGKDLHLFLTKVGTECFRVLKPGGFMLAFSQARLVHRVGMAIEDSGFDIKDMLGWTYEGQGKAFKQDHFIRKMKISDEEKECILRKLDGRKTPQLKPMIEPIILGQKPKEGTFVENWLKYGVGLIDTSQKWNDKYPGNIVNCKKPSKLEKGIDNLHLTVKPIDLIQHLIKIFSKPGDVVLDPFMGSGTTAIAALKSDRKCVGFEKEKTYYDLSIKRLDQLK